MSTRIINDWVPETTALLNRLTAAGFMLVSGDNGEDEFRFNGNLPEFVANLIACDEARLYLRNPSNKKRWIYLVLGNEPGVIASDYSVDEGIDAVVDAHYAEWSGRAQPKRTVEY